MHERQKVPIAKHLEDVDDLTYRRDSGLVEGQEVRAETMADAIYEHALENNLKVVLFCVSTKKRARETAELVSGFLRSKPNSPKVLVETDNNLREIDQGTFVLPKDYKAGDEYEGLKIAGKVFSRETFNPTDPGKDNLDYHFGDPLKQKDGTYKYPELVQYFLHMENRIERFSCGFMRRCSSLSQMQNDLAIVWV